MRPYIFERFMAFIADDQTLERVFYSNKVQQHHW